MWPRLGNHWWLLEARSSSGFALLVHKEDPLGLARLQREKTLEPYPSSLRAHHHWLGSGEAQGKARLGLDGGPQASLCAGSSSPSLQCGRREGEPGKGWRRKANCTSPTWSFLLPGAVGQTRVLGRLGSVIHGVTREQEG